MRDPAAPAVTPRPVTVTRTLSARGVALRVTVSPPSTPARTPPGPGPSGRLARGHPHCARRPARAAGRVMRSRSRKGSRGVTPHPLGPEIPQAAGPSSEGGETRPLPRRWLSHCALAEGQNPPAAPPIHRRKVCVHTGQPVTRYLPFSGSPDLKYSNGRSQAELGTRSIYPEGPLGFFPGGHTEDKVYRGNRPQGRNRESTNIPSEMILDV